MNNQIHIKHYLEINYIKDIKKILHTDEMKLNAHINTHILCINWVKCPQYGTISQRQSHTTLFITLSHNINQHLTLLRGKDG